MTALLSKGELSRLRRSISTNMKIPVQAEKSLSNMLAISVGNFGSLIRAQLAYKCLSLHGISAGRACKLACAVEYFHLASLIFDDLPCMDNAEMRRHKPCAHIVFGEATSILGALALINRAYAILWSLFEDLPKERSHACAKLTEECIGLAGLVQGQAKDLALRNTDVSLRDVDEVARGKTAALFRLTLLLSAQIAGASQAEIHRLSRFSYTLGSMYQLLDDVKDINGAPSSSGKTPRDACLDSPNAVLSAGQPAVAARFDRLMQIAARIVATLEKRNTRWAFLRTLLGQLDVARERQFDPANLPSLAKTA